jgi:Outer membrane protein
MKIFPLFIFIFFFPVLLNAQESSLTVENAIKYALKNNPAIIAAAKNAEASAHGESAAKAKYLPSVDVTALGVKLDDAIYIDLNEIRSAVIGAGIISGGNPSVLEQSIPSFEKKISDDMYMRVKATVTQPVFTGFKISANSEIKKIERTVSEVKLKASKNFVVTSVIEDYYRVKLTDKLIEIRKDFLENIENHVSNAQKLFNNGMISKANLLRTEVALAEAKKDYQKAMMDKELAAILLDNTLGIKIEGALLSSPMEMIDGRKNSGFYVSKSENNNTSLLLLNSKKLMLKQKHKTAVGNLLPSVAAMGEYQILRDKLMITEPEWTIAVQASINIFGGGSDINEIKASKTEIEAIEAQIEDARNLIFTGVKKLYHQCETAKKDHEALEANKTLAEENLKLYRASFREGLATSLEVVDAELALTKIKIDQAKAVFDYNAAYANLLNICAVSEEELAPKYGEKK